SRSGPGECPAALAEKARARRDRVRRPVGLSCLGVGCSARACPPAGRHARGSRIASAGAPRYRTRDRMATSDDEDFAALLAASEAKGTRELRIAAGDVVRGRVIAVGATTAFVAVGGKAEATIDLGEFRDPRTGEVQLREGDEVEATVVDDGTRSGSIVLKRVAG